MPYFQMGLAVSRREADLSLLRDFPRLQLSAGLTIDNVHAWLYYLFWILPFACVLLALGRRITRRERWSGEWVAIVAIAVMAVALDATFLRNPLATRLADATVPAALLGAWLLGLAWSMKSPLSMALAARAAAAVVVSCTLVAIWAVGDVNGKLDEVGVFEDDLEHLQEHTASTVTALTMPEVDLRKHPSRVSAALVPFLRYVSRCTEVRDRMLVSGPYPEVFVYARRGFAGGHIAFLEAIYQLRRRSRAHAEAACARVRPLRDPAARQSGCLRRELSEGARARDRGIRADGGRPGRRVEGHPHHGRTRTGAKRHGQRNRLAVLHSTRRKHVTPRWTRLAYAYGLLVAAVLGYFLLGLVIQVSDSFGNMLAVQTPTLGELLSGQFSQRAYLRPLLWAQLKIVYELSGGDYFLWFRGIHVAQVLLLIVLYLGLVRPRTALDASLVPLSLAVLIGAHTFVPMVREAFPINGFLTMAVCCVGAATLALREDSHWYWDLLAIGVFVGSVLTVESGVLVWIICVAAYALGARGLSRRGLVAMTGCLLGYLLLRTFVLDVGTPSLAERASGFGFGILEPADLQARFEGRAWPFYAYNVASSISTVLFSEPKGGVWRFVYELTTGTLHPWSAVSVASSTAATVLVSWFVWTRRHRIRTWSFDRSDRLVALFLVVLAANAAISFPYTKNVIMSPAGVFLGLAVSVAAREWFRDPAARRLAATLALFAVLTCGWAYRVAGNHYNLRWTAAEQRAMWVSVDGWLDRQRITPRGAEGPALRDALRRDALWTHPTPYQPSSAWAAWFDIDW